MKFPSTVSSFNHICIRWYCLSFAIRILLQGQYGANTYTNTWYVCSYIPKHVWHRFRSSTYTCCWEWNRIYMLCCCNNRETLPYRKCPSIWYVLKLQMSTNGVQMLSFRDKLLLLYLLLAVCGRSSATVSSSQQTGTVIPIRFFLAYF